MAWSVLRRRARISLISTLLAFAVWLVAAASASAFSAQGSVNQVYATGLPANAQASLLNSSGATVYTQNADAQGGLLFRNVKAADGQWRELTATEELRHPITVHTAAAAPWDPSVYNQSIPENGYTYLTTRDGTQLALTVHPPTSPAGQPGAPSSFHFPTFPASTGYAPPYPTLIEYSGYGYANPKGPENGIAVLANLMGFAVVDVNMRGTGCSGGAYDFFEPLQNLDGYDVIETIAKQPWVAGHKVGMLGISYGGISQMFTAQLQPPDLAAIAPLSVIDATATTLYPGGILNTGFAVAWAQERQQQAQAAPAAGTQPYATTQINSGDQTCKDNQVLHPEAADLMAKIRANQYYNPVVADPLDPVTFVNKINVPTFLACQWEDEQTGGHCPELVRHFTGTSRKWFTFTNGAHIDSLDPETYNRWYDFLELFVAHQAPIENVAVTQAAAPVIYQTALGLPKSDVVTLPVDPIQAIPTYDAALTASEWDWKWQQQPSGSAVSYVSAPLTTSTTVIGSGAVYLWVRSSTPDVDLQATISEVRADGNETFVQNGWIRASERKLSTDANNIFKRLSTTLEPIPTFTAADASPMPAGQFVKVAVPLYYQGHAYRVGSRIRVTIAAPNGTQPIWSFSQTQPTSGSANVSIAFSTS